VGYECIEFRQLAVGRARTFRPACTEPAERRGLKSAGPPVTFRGAGSSNVRQVDEHRAGGTEMEAAREVNTDVVVVGGGMAGLVAAAMAARSGASVSLVDGAHLGGRARTTDKDGYWFNQGPHAVYLSGATGRVLQDLGVALPGGPPATTTSRVVYRGEVHRLPATPKIMMTSGLMGLGDKARMGRLLARLPRIDIPSVAGHSTRQWIEGLGLGDAATALVTMLVRLATYSSDLDRLSADVAVGQLRGVVAGPGVRYLDGGWQRMVDGLAAIATTAGARLVAHQPVRSIEAGPAGYRVVTDAESIVARSLIVASGSPANAERLLPADVTYRGLGPDVTAACLDLGLASAPQPVAMFGLDEPLYLSTHCPPADLAPEGGAVVHVMRNGARDAAADQAELWAFAARARITPADAVTQRFLPHMTVSHASPVPENGGLAGRPGIEVAGLPGAFVAGDWVGGEGLLADASVASASEAATAAVAHLAHRPVTAAVTTAAVGRTG
jgi:phytoene dehydrogenase-like protein